MTRHQSIMLFRSILLRSQGCHSKTAISRFQSNTGSAHCENTKPNDITVHGNKYNYDNWTNITPKILSLSERKLHLNPKHPLGLIKQNIINYVYSRYNQNLDGQSVGICLKINYFCEFLCELLGFESDFEKILIRVMAFRIWSTSAQKSSSKETRSTSSLHTYSGYLVQR